MFRELLQHPEIDEVCVLRDHDSERTHRMGFMAYHGGGLEVMTEVIAQAAAERCGASYYGVHQPRGMEVHVPSIEVSPDHSDRLRDFIDHVGTVITIHGYGRPGLYTTLLLGGRHRRLASHIGAHIARHPGESPGPCRSADRAATESARHNAVVLGLGGPCLTSSHAVAGGSTGHGRRLMEAVAASGLTPPQRVTGRVAR